MAINEVQRPGWIIQVTKASVASGDPVVYGQLTGVAIEASFTDAAGNANQVEIDTGPTHYSLSVKGIDGSGSSAVGAGDAIYLTDGDTPKLSKKATGVLFGYALGPAGTAAAAQLVAGNATATITVAHIAR